MRYSTPAVPQRDLDGSTASSPLIAGRDGDATPPWVVRRLVCLCWAVCACNVTFGYDVGAVSETLTSIQAAFGLSDLMAGAFTGALNLVAAIGALVDDYWCELLRTLDFVGLIPRDRVVERGRRQHIGGSIAVDVDR